MDNQYPNLTQQQLDAIAQHMDDEIRENLHGDTDVPGEFLTAYVSADPDFVGVLSQFNTGE